MIVRFTNAYRDTVNEFICHNETRLSLKPRIREINEKLSELKTPMIWTLGVLTIDSPFEPLALKAIACLYTRHPKKDDEIAPCLLYFPYDAAILSISRQGMKEKIAAVKAELGWKE